MVTGIRQILHGFDKADVSVSDFRMLKLPCPKLISVTYFVDFRLEGERFETDFLSFDNGAISRISDAQI